MNENSDDAAAAAALGRLNKWGGPRLVRDMTAIFAEETPRRLVELRAALEQNDHDAAIRATHSIRSSASQLGAVALADLATRAERIAESPQMEAGPDLVREMEIQLEQFLAWIRKSGKVMVVEK